MKQESKIITTQMVYRNKVINAKIVSITSTFNHNAEAFFNQELIRENTLKIVKPLAKISFLKQNADSPFWKEGFKYELNIKPFGLINIWGIHYIKVMSINPQTKVIVTEERNNICKIWNHSLTFTKLSETQTQYTDEVILYAGNLTSILSRFLVFSYKKRHQNWEKLLALS